MSKSRIVRKLIPGVVALALTATGCGPRHEAPSTRGVPGRLNFPWDEAKMTIYQRASKTLAGADGHLRMQLSDITAGRVLVAIEGPNGEAVVDAASLQQGDILSIPLAEQSYVLRLDRLVNVLIGHDFAVFSLMPSQIWRVKNSVPRRLDLPWDRARMTIFQRASKKLPGEDGFLRVELGDISVGRVLVTVSGPNGEVVVDTTSLRQGDLVSLALAERDYVLRLDKLVNLPLGDDYAVFSLMMPQVWEAEKIDWLLDIIAASDGVFLRNDEELSGSAFAAHLRRKHDYYGAKNATVDEFIENIASRSVSTGNPYRVRLPDGGLVDASVWLREQGVNVIRASQEVE
jgi:hypothetical protein